MNVRSLFLNKQGLTLSLIALVLAATSLPAAAQGVSAAPQRLENLDAKGLSAIAARTKLPDSIKRSPQLDTVVSQLRKGDQNAALANWTSYISEINKQGVPVDMDALVQWVLRESYLQSSADLKDTADKIRYYNEAKKRLRDEIAQGRTDLSEVRPWPRDRRVAVFRKKYTRGADPVEREEKRNVDRKALEILVREYENLLGSLVAEDQAANLDLQSALQKQQQTMQMISRVNKQLHDTAMAIIRKIGG